MPIKLYLAAINNRKFIQYKEIFFCYIHAKPRRRLCMNITDFLNNGSVFINGRKVRAISTIAWDKHPKFEGVFTKNIFNDSENNNNINAMIVKIEPNKEIGMHIHEGKFELHEMIDGEGEAIIDNKRIEYFPGIVSLIPADIQHCLKAGNKGILLLAKFTPSSN
jgi:quercetin dioxygenase-like cupin family protein